MMADEKHLDILKQGVGTRNQWRKENPEIRPDLSSADLFEADLSGSDLREADLSGADLILWKLDIGHMHYLPT